MSVKTERVLLIGGRFDGEWREVDIRKQVIAPVWQIPVPVEIYGSAEPQVSRCTIEKVIYVRKVWGVECDARGMPQHRSFFVHEELEPSQILDKLLQNYYPVRFAALEAQARRNQCELEYLRNEIKEYRKCLGFKP